MTLDSAGSEFVPPKDLEYITLRREYAFNEQALRNQFIATVNQINLDNMMLAKQHNLILFRETCDPSISLPVELFAYDQSPVGPHESLALKSVLPWTSEVAQYDLSTEFSKVYAGIPWISTYFAISSFPAIYGHFVSEEYLQYGLCFIQSHIKDALAPHLVGSYLLHCFLFRDRLAHVFYELLIERNPDLSPAELLQTFTDAFAFCVPYFSDIHISAVLCLRAESEGKAIRAVFTHFLLEVVRVWQFHPLFATTELIRRRTRDPVAPSSYLNITYEFVLLDEIRKMGEDPVRAIQILDLLVDEIGIEMPKLSSIVYYGGITLPLSVVDFTLLLHLNELHKVLTNNGTNVREIKGNVETAIVDAFRLRARSVHYLPPSVSAPVPTAVSVHLTLQKLKEHKTLHEFLSGLAGGLKQFHTIIAAQKNINRLYYFSLAHRKFLASGSQIQPATYAAVQHQKYALHIFDQFVRGGLQLYVRAHTKERFQEFHEQAIGQLIAESIARGESPVTAILERTVDYINGWKQRFNADNPAMHQGACFANREHDYPLCQFFTDAVDHLAFAFTMNRLSACPFPIISERVEIADQREAVETLLQSMSQHWPFVSVTPEQILQDAEITIIMESSRDAHFLLQKAEQAAMASFAAGDVKWDSGNHIPLFLEIESLLRPIFSTDTIVDLLRHDPEWPRKFIAAFFNATDPVFLRACLSRSLMIVSSLRDVNHPLIEHLAEIGNPITVDVMRSFANLRDWFDFKPKLFPVCQ
jgi:hypothetical protein